VVSYLRQYNPNRNTYINTTMTALEQAIELGRAQEGEYTFEDDLAFHLSYGVVYADNENFLMMRPVRKDEPESFETYKTWSDGSPDAWFVWTAVGEMKKLAQLVVGGVAKRYPTIIKRGNGKIKYIPFDKILQSL
jgi:hypothetical protein